MPDDFAEVEEIVATNESLYDCVLGGDIDDEEEMVLAFVDSDEMWEFRG